MKTLIVIFAVVAVGFSRPQFAKYDRLKIGDPTRQVDIDISGLNRISGTGAGGGAGLGTGGGAGGRVAVGGDGSGASGRGGGSSGSGSGIGNGIGAGGGASALGRGGNTGGRGGSGGAGGTSGARISPPLPSLVGGSGRGGAGGGLVSRISNTKTRPQTINLGDPNADYVRIVYQAQDQDEDGSYEWSYETENGIGAQEKGTVINPGQDTQSLAANGYYSFVAPDNVKYEVYYVADDNGFRAEGAHLPTAPPIPDAILRSLEWNAAHPEEDDLRK